MGAGTPSRVSPAWDSRVTPGTPTGPSTHTEPTDLSISIGSHRQTADTNSHGWSRPNKEDQEEEENNSIDEFSSTKTYHAKAEIVGSAVIQTKAPLVVT